MVVTDVTRPQEHRAALVVVVAEMRHQLGAAAPALEDKDMPAGLVARVVIWAVVVVVEQVVLVEMQLLHLLGATAARVYHLILAVA